MISKNIKSFFSFKAIGIDLGTTKSRMAILSESDKGKLEIIDPNYSINTNALIDPNGNKHIGIDPTNSIFNCENLIYDISRVLGKNLYDRSTQIHLKRVPYKLVEPPNESYNNIESSFCIHNTHYRSAQVLSWIIKNLKTKAEEIIKQPIFYSGISVPSFFDSSQRIAIKNAAELAGLKALVVNASSAIVLGHDDKLKENSKKNRKVLVINIGSGTMDLSIISVGNGVYNVKDTQGSSSFGGLDFDYAVQDELWKILKEKSEGNILDDANVRWKLKNLAESAKIQLSSKNYVTLNDYFVEKSGKIFNFLHKISREEFEALASKELNFFKEKLEYMINTHSDINEILISGGTTKIPAIKNLINNFSKQIPITFANSESDLAVGALINLSIHRKLRSDLALNDILTLPVSLAASPELEADLVSGTPLPAFFTKEYGNMKVYQFYDETYIYQGNPKIISENSLIWQNKIEIKTNQMDIMRLLVLNASVNREGIFNAKIFDKAKYHYGLSFNEMSMTEILKIIYHEEIKESIINQRLKGNAYQMFANELEVFIKSKIEDKWKEYSLESENYTKRYWDSYLVDFVYKKEDYKSAEKYIEIESWFPYGEPYEEH